MAPLECVYQEVLYMEAAIMSPAMAPIIAHNEILICDHTDLFRVAPSSHWSLYGSERTDDTAHSFP